MTPVTTRRPDQEIAMSSVMKTKVISVEIEAKPERVYAYCVDPRNLPHWIPSFARSVEQVAGKWVVHTEQGDATVRFVAENSFGVLDHHVTLATGQTVYNPLRVVANGGGSTVSLTLFRQPGVTDDAYAQDAGHVASDLGRLKQVLEAR
jgi:uncharacterized protein YndB with AHSA1/START domain